MTWRYLFGPVTAAFAQHNLLRQRQAGSCLGFDAAGTTDLKIGPADTWEEVRARLPAGWQPDFVVLYLQYTSVPACLWSAPVPRVGLAGDWNLLWHAYRRLLRRCDLTFTDSTGVETMAREGIAHVRPAHLFGLGRRFAAGPQPLSPPTLGEGKGGGARDIDVLFVGNLHPAVQRERLPWLARLARLGERWRVAIRTGVFGEDYRNLLGRARIVFNRAIRGECNMRAFEAAAAGALLFQEAGNCEVPTYFRDRQECVYYTGENLETLLEYYLEHEDERQAIAAAAREKARTCLFEDLWDGILGQIDEEWPALQERSQQRPAPTLALSPAEARGVYASPLAPLGERGWG